MKMGKPVYKLAVGLALATPLLLAWMIGAVGVLGREGDPADWMYIGVFAVGIICAVAARTRKPAYTRLNSGTGSWNGPANSGAQLRQSTIAAALGSVPGRGCGASSPGKTRISSGCVDGRRQSQ